MNPIAARMIDVQLLFEDGTAPEISEVCRIGAQEIERLQKLVDNGKQCVWSNRRFYFKTLQMPPNTALATIFNAILKALGESPEENAATYALFYPDESAHLKEGERS